MSTLSNEPGKLFVSLLLRSHRVAKGLAAAVQLPADELYCLAVIHTECPSCVKELSRLLDARGPRTSKILGSLEGKGYIRRSLSPEDHRREEITLTEAGTGAVERVLHVLRGAMETIPAAAQVEQLQRLLSLLDQIRIPTPSSHGARPVAAGAHRGWFVLPDEE